MVNSDRVYFFHLRPKDKDGYPKIHGGMTIAACLEDHEDHQSMIVYTASKCGKKDHFCKRIGRAVAEGRLKAGKDLQVYLSNDLKVFSEFVFSLKV